MDSLVVGAALLSGSTAGLVGAVRSWTGCRVMARAAASGLPTDERQLLQDGAEAPSGSGPVYGPRSGPAPERGEGLRRRLPVRTTTRGERVLTPQVVRIGVSLLVGSALALTMGGLAGLMAGVLVGAAGYRFLPDPPSSEERCRRRVRAELAAQLPLAADLLAGCLSSWCAPAEAAEAVADAVGEPMASRLARVAAEIRTGADAEASWGRFGAEPALAPLARCLVRAVESGAPPAAGLARLAEGSRAAAATAAQARVRRAGVLAVAPLGLCFLPAFVLIGVVPVVAGLVGSFLLKA